MGREKETKIPHEGGGAVHYTFCLLHYNNTAKSLVRVVETPWVEEKIPREGASVLRLLFQTLLHIWLRGGFIMKNDKLVTLCLHRVIIVQKQ